MNLATGDLRDFLVAQVVGEQAALGFHYEVQALLPSLGRTGRPSSGCRFQAVSEL